MRLGPVEGFVLGAAATLALMGAAGGAIMETGAFDTRASTPHSYLLAWAVHTTMIHSAHNRSADLRAPARFTPAETEAGFRFYDRDCSRCHGGPGLARDAWVAGMNPSPPYLVDASHHWTRAELYWIIANGVKMTAMPAWGGIRTRGEMWDIVAFLDALPFVSAPDYARLRAASGEATRPSPDDAQRQRGAARPSSPPGSPPVTH